MKFVIIDLIMTLTRNIDMFSGNNPDVMFAKASIFLKCKIQTLCVKTNIRVSFTPPDVTDEDGIKILYYHHHNFSMCQRVVKIKMNEGNQDLTKQMGLDFLVIQAHGRNDNVKFDYEDFLTKMIGM